MNRNNVKDLKDLRILVIATTFPRWEKDQEPRFVFDLSKELAKTLSLWVLVPHAPGAKTNETMQGVRIIRFPYFYPRSLETVCYEGGILPKLKSSWLARFQLPFFLAAQFYFMCKTVRKHKINFIHCHWLIPQGFFTALLKMWSRVPFLLTAHGGDVYSFKKFPIVLKLNRFALKRSSGCTANSEATRKAVKKYL